MTWNIKIEYISEKKNYVGKVREIIVLIYRI